MKTAKSNANDDQPDKNLPARKQDTPLQQLMRADTDREARSALYRVLADKQRSIGQVRNCLQPERTVRPRRRVLTGQRQGRHALPPADYQRT